MSRKPKGAAVGPKNGEPGYPPSLVATKRTTGQPWGQERRSKNPQIPPQRKKRSRLFMPGEPYWAVVRTKAGQESYARDNLAKQGFEVYYPRCSTGRGKLEPVFRTYLFVKIVDQWMVIENTFGVQGLIKTFDMPTKVHPNVIKGLKKLENREGYIEFAPPRDLIEGESIVITRGGFKGQVMFFDGLTSEGRVKALYEFLGSTLTVEFNRRYVAPTGDPSSPIPGEAKVPPAAVASQKPSNNEPTDAPPSKQSRKSKRNKRRNKPNAR